MREKIIHSKIARNTKLQLGRRCGNESRPRMKRWATKQLKLKPSIDLISTSIKADCQRNAFEWSIACTAQKDTKCPSEPVLSL